MSKQPVTPSGKQTSTSGGKVPAGGQSSAHDAENNRMDGPPRHTDLNAPRPTKG